MNNNDNLKTEIDSEDIDVAESTGMEEGGLLEEGAGSNELEDARKEAAELKDKYLRVVAEMQNLQRRNQRDVEDAAKYSISSAARPLLDVADNLARALDAIPADIPANINNVLDGIRATQKTLQSSLEKMGVKPVDAVAGLALNPHEHEVMFEVETTDHEHGKIVQVLETGYKIHDRLLRPARVSVAKNNSASNVKNVDFSA